MCLAIPARIVECRDEMAVVDMNGVRREASIAFLPDLQVGDYVLLHAGFAIAKWTEEDVRQWQAIVGDAFDRDVDRPETKG